MISEVRYGTQAEEYQAFKAMFHARKEVFIDLLGWDLPVLAERYEVDHFDTTEARYLILMEEGRRHRASARLLRTDRPHLLGDCFSDLCAGALPVGPTVLEITRFCLDRHQRAKERRSARNQLVAALASYALDFGITAYTGVAEVGWFQQICNFGWHCEALGPARKTDMGNLIGLHITITSDTLELLSNRGIYEPLNLTMASSFCRGSLQ